MQGVIKAYDPASGLGVIMCDTDLADYDLASDALKGSIFRRRPRPLVDLICGWSHLHNLSPRDRFDPITGVPAGPHCDQRGIETEYNGERSS